VGGQDAAAPLTSELLQQHDQEQVAVGQVTAGRRRSAASSSSSSSSDTGSDKGSEGLLEYLQALGVEVAEGAGGQADADSGAQGTPAVAAVCADAQAAPRSSASAAAEEATPGALEGQASEQASSLVGRAAEAAPGVPQEGAEEAGTGAAPADGVAGTSCVSVNGDSSPCDGTLTSSSSSSDSDDDEGVELCVDVQLQQAMERALSQANPLQVAGTLHRVCAVRGVTGKVTGLTYHVGRHLPRLASVARQVLGRVAAGVNAGHQASLLVVGRPGSGKTTLLQSLAAALAAPCEAGGYGLQVLVVLPASMAPVASAEGTSGTAATPGSGLEAEDCEGTAATAATTSCWGNCRVVVAAPGASMGAAALAAAQQHLAQVVVMDDLSCAEVRVGHGRCGAGGLVDWQGLGGRPEHSTAWRATCMTAAGMAGAGTCWHSVQSCVRCCAAMLILARQDAAWQRCPPSNMPPLSHHTNLPLCLLYACCWRRPAGTGLAGSCRPGHQRGDPGGGCPGGHLGAPGVWA
jgi:hypothetical protein